MNHYNNNGWYVVPRGLFFTDFLESQNDKFTAQKALLWIYETAAYENTSTIVQNKRVFLKRGQLSFSTRFLAKKFGWKHSTTYRFLQRLQDVNVIELESETGQSLITLCKYDISDFPDKNYETEKKQDAQKSSTKNKTKKKNNLNINSTSLENFKNLIVEACNEDKLGQFKNLTPAALNQEIEACWEHWEANDSFPKGSEVSAFKRWLREALRRKNINIASPQRRKTKNAFEEVKETEEWRIKMKKEIGDTAYNSWIRELIYDGQHTLIAPSRFKAQWVRTHYLISLQKYISSNIVIRELEKTEVTS